MASTLQELRKEAGFATAPEFAARMEIPPSTYARYESRPEKIPMDKARQMADFFGVPIDVVVGRSPRDDARGEIQRRYDRLSPRSKAALEEFLSFLIERDIDEGMRLAEEEEHRYEAAAWRYERLFIEELEGRDDFEDLLVLGTEDELRAAFERFVAGRVSARLEGAAAAERVRRLMEAYDRLHDIWVRGGGRSLRPIDFFGEVHVS